MEVGKQSLLGLGAGLVGGGAAIGVSKLVPTVARAAAPAVHRIVSGVRSTTRSAVSSGTQGATSNVLDYSFNNDGPKTVAGYAGSAAWGFSTGAAFTGASSKVASSVVSNLGPASPVLVKKGASLVTDHVKGGVQGVTNEWFRPGGSRNETDLQISAWNGLISGASGPTTGTRASRIRNDPSEIDSE